MRTDGSGGGRTPRENSLRLNERDLLRLVRTMDADEGSGSSAREHVRWCFAKTRVELTVEQPGGSRQTMVVATRNLSRRGISALHSAFVYPGTACTVRFETEGGGPVLVGGTIVRCAHVSGRVHEVGIVFEAEVSTREILGLDPMLEAYSLERVDASSLHGTVLIVAGSELEQRLLVGALEETNLSIRVASTGEDARAKAEEGVDLMVCDAFLGDGESGVDLVAELRGSGFDSPVVVMGNANAGAERDDIRMSGANGFLSKPVAGDRLMRAAAEFLLGGGDGSPIYSTLEAGDPALEMVGAFLKELPRLALSLEKAMQENDMGEALRVCRVLHGTGEPLGYAELSGLAACAERSLAGASSVRNGGADLRSLVIACRRVKYRKTG